MMSSKGIKEKGLNKKRYFAANEKEENAVTEPLDIIEKKKRKNSEDIIKLRPKKAHKEKKKLVSQLKSLHEILKSTKFPDEEEDMLQQEVFGDIIEEEEEIISSEKEYEVETTSRKPVWDDEDDQHIQVKEKTKSYRNCHRSITAQAEEKYADYVQEKFKKIVGEPEWADLGRKLVDSDTDSEDELLQRTGNFVKNSETLPKGYINIRKCSSLTHENLKNSIIKSVEFHPSSRVALVAGTNGVANLFQVDGKLNSKIQSIYFESFPIHTAHFTIEGNEIVAGSNMYGFFYTYDMLAGKVLRVPCQKGMEQKNIRRFHMSPDGKYIAIHGRYGNIHLITTKTKEWIGSLKMNGEVISIAFNNEGSKMYSHGESGEVYIWDVNSRKCLHKFTDEGCINGTSIAVSPNDQFIATGSDSGIVNLYDCTKNLFSSSAPVPVKTVKNLTTEITALEFNATTELLALGSSYKIGSCRLMHLSSTNIFANFPAKEDYKSIKNMNSFAFSPNSGFAMMGINNGNALLYRLKHYKNY